MGKRHRIEQYYSIRVGIGNGKVVVLNTNGWDGTVENLAKLINDSTNKKWEKLRLFKYTQSVDTQKTNGSRIVSKKRSCLKINRQGMGSLCTEVDENLMRNGVIPQNILAFFGENQK